MKEAPFGLGPVLRVAPIYRLSRAARSGDLSIKVVCKLSVLCYI